MEEEALQLRSRVCCGDFNHVWNVSETIGRSLGSSEMEKTFKREAKEVNRGIYSESPGACA